MAGTPKVIYGEKRRFLLSGQGKSGVLSGDHEFTLARRQASDGGRDIAE